VSAGTRTVAYGDDPSQFGELTLPPGPPRGVAVLVHGGFWKAAYGIEYARPLVPSLVAAGWATWAIEYRRVGNGGGLPQTLDDVMTAIAKLDALGLDLATVVALGHSAGGHLATWAGSTGRLTHVVSQAGVLDLGAAYALGLGDGAVEAFLGHPPGPHDGDVDPVRQVPLGVPVWCVHGRADDIVPISQSLSYVRAATTAGAPAELVEVEGDHFAVIDPGSVAWERTLAILESLSPAPAAG
jgi:acetyl esterase/lipase